MTYAETLDYMFNALPMFQRIGAAAFKKDLSNTLLLCSHLGNPEKQLKTIHVAGTNGKGSTSHMLSAILMKAGYKVGLYTSPHLKSFTERIKINGVEIPEESVIEFIENNKDYLDEVKPSFFEMTVGMAFWYFAHQKVDIAVIEVGMGGRLDSTNVITPELSLITNIGYDHMQFLGNTLPLIAQEKAGIIKKSVPVVISQRQKAVEHVFAKISGEQNTKLFFAEDFFKVRKVDLRKGLAIYKIRSIQGEEFDLSLQLMGDYQAFNLPGVLMGITILNELGWEIPQIAIEEGLSNVVNLTGLKGRWQLLGSKPTIICDTGHNEDGVKFIIEQLNQYSFKSLWMVIGMVNDKDITKVLQLFPKTAKMVFCQANIPRALDANVLGTIAEKEGLSGEVIPDINQAIDFAKKNAGKEDLIFIGGSTFVVAEIKDL